MKRLCHDHRLQVYMCDFLYVDPEIMVEGKYFPDTKIFAENYKRRSNIESSPKYWLRFRYICSEDYDLDMNL